MARRELACLLACFFLTWPSVPWRAVVALQHPALARFLVETLPEVGARQGVPIKPRLHEQGLYGPT